MKISRIDKSDLLTIEEKPNHLSVIYVPTSDIEDDRLNIIIAVGDDSHPVSQAYLNNLTANIVFLLASKLSINPTTLSNVDVTILENVPLYYPSATKYSVEQFTSEELIENLEKDPFIVDNFWVFISTGDDMLQSEIDDLREDLTSKFLNLSGLILEVPIAIFFE